MKREPVRKNLGGIGLKSARIGVAKNPSILLKVSALQNIIRRLNHRDKNMSRIIWFDSPGLIDDYIYSDHYVHIGNVLSLLYLNIAFPLTIFIWRKHYE